MTNAAALGTTNWYLVGKPTGSGTCDHCGRALKNLYTVVNPEALEMTVGRGCVKKLTGWNLTDAEARRLLWLAKRDANRAVNWTAFETENPEVAQLITDDCAAAEEKIRAYSAAHELRDRIADGYAYIDDLISHYVRRRSDLSWT